MGISNNIYKYYKGGMVTLGDFPRVNHCQQKLIKLSILATCYSCHLLLLIVTIFQVVTVVTILGV